MNSALLIWPVLAQVLLSLLLYIPLIRRKFKAAKLGEVDLKQTKLNNQAWPDYVVRVSNNIANQFESPILFYVLCFVLASESLLSPTVLVLAWAFVICRCVHSYIHISSNYVPWRMRAFAVSWSLLLALLICAVYQLLN